MLAENITKQTNRLLEVASNTKNGNRSTSNNIGSFEGADCEPSNERFYTVLSGMSSPPRLKDSHFSQILLFVFDNRFAFAEHDGVNSRFRFQWFFESILFCV